MLAGPGLPHPVLHVPQRGNASAPREASDLGLRASVDAGVFSFVNPVGLLRSLVIQLCKERAHSGLSPEIT